MRESSATRLKVCFVKVFLIYIQSDCGEVLRLFQTVNQWALADLFPSGLKLSCGGTWSRRVQAASSGGDTFLGGCFLLWLFFR